MERVGPRYLIAPSARKHLGDPVADDDMIHAIEHSQRWFLREDGARLIAGPDRDGRLIEVGYVSDPFGVLVIIHALRPARGKWRR